MSFSIKTWYAKHEGGTKFYKVYALARVGGEAVCITHWGATGDGLDLKPKWYGQTKRKNCLASNVEWEADRMRTAKKNRGYKFGPPSTEIYSPDEFSVAVHALLKSRDADEVLEYIGLEDRRAEVDGEIDPVDGSFVPSKRTRKTKPAPAADIDRGESWGSW